MLKINQICTVDIIDVEPVSGHGVAKIDSFVIFIPFTITDEKVKIKITTVKKSHAKGKLIEIIEASPHRIKPICKHYYACGGCSYQHVSYKYQLRLKALSLKNNINKLAGLNIENINIIHSDSDYSYRNRIKLTIRKNQAGFINNNYNFIPIDKCAIANKTINKQFKNLPTNKSKFTHIHIRVDNNNGLVMFLENKKTKKLISDNKSLKFTISDRTFKINPFSFFQINTSILTKFKKAIESKLPPKSNDEILLDLFCGSGFFSLLFADRFSNVIGLEIDKQAVEAAKENAQANNISNAHFLSGSVEQNIKKIIAENKNKQISVIIDPPRAGVAKDTVKCINESNISQIIYISCYPPTFARDIKLLKDKYAIENIEAIDMFPQTAHTEIICLLKRKSS